MVLFGESSRVSALTIFFLVVLAVAWVGVFWPAVRRARQNTPLQSSERFARRMEMIAPRHSPTAGRRLIAAQPARRGVRSYRKSQRQRTRILVVLVGLVVASAAGAVILGGGWWELQMVCDLSLGVYAALLLEAKRRRKERLAKVRPLASRPPQGSTSASQRVRASAGSR